MRLRHKVIAAICAFFIVVALGLQHLRHIKAAHAEIPRKQLDAQGGRTNLHGKTQSRRADLISEKDLGIGHYNNEFAKLSPLEANAVLNGIRKSSLENILESFFEAGSLERDLTKQTAIATTMAFALREQEPSEAMLARLREIILDESGSRIERGLLLGAVGTARTREGVVLLLEMLPEIHNKEFRQLTLNLIGSSGAGRGDGRAHEEISPAVEKAWRESADNLLLANLAKAMAEVGTPTGIESLLSAALQTDIGNEYRARIATAALENVSSSNAGPPIVKLLKQQDTGNVASRLAATLLVAIGNKSSAESLANWLQVADDGAASLVPELVRRTKTPEFETLWRNMLGNDVHFRSAVTREAIRTSLAEHRRSVFLRKVTQ